MPMNTSLDEFEDAPCFEGDELLGIQINFDDQRGRVWFPLSKGLTLMYGKNGAGKSQVLNSIKMALRGTRPRYLGFFQEREIQIVIRCAVGDGKIFQALVAGLFKHLQAEYNAEMDINKTFNEICEVLEIDPVDIDEEWFKAGDAYQFSQFINCDWQQLAKLYVLSMWMMHPSPGQLDPKKHENSQNDVLSIRRFILELAEERIAILTPMGTVEKPQWQLTLGADTLNGASARGRFAAETVNAWSKWLFDNMDEDGTYRGLFDHGEFLEDEDTQITKAFFARDMGYRDEFHSRFLSIQFYTTHGEEQWVDEIPFRVLNLNGIETLPAQLSRMALDEFGELELVELLNEHLEFSPEDSINKDFARLYNALSNSIEAIKNLGIYISEISVQSNTKLTEIAEKNLFEIYVIDSRFPNQKIPFLDLSKAQQKAIEILVAIEVAKFDNDQCVIVVGDEIDQSFHEAVITALYDELQKSKLSVLAVTHSFQALVSAGGKKRQISCTSNGLKNSQFTSSDIAASASDLGVSKSSLLGLTDLFVIVEGEHDQIVINEILASSNLGVGLQIQVLPMRGTENVLRILDSRLLQYSDARIIVVADNDLNGVINGRFSNAKESVAGGVDAQEIKSEILRAKTPNETQEVKQLTNLIIDAVERGMLDRLSVFAMSKGDIIEYLPSGDFELRGTWEELRAQHMQWSSGLKPKSAKDFKTFLRVQLRGMIDSKVIEKSIQNLDSLHPDFLALLDQIRIFSSRTSNF